MNKKEYFKKWWIKHKHLHRNRIKTRNIKNRKEIKQKIAEYLLNHPCVDCGNSDIRVLEFDHVRGKKFKAISMMVSLSYSWITILKEIAKCEIRCANCHRIKTKATYEK